ncbi:MAG: cation-efflux pump [Thermoplasmata archaeon]
MVFNYIQKILGDEKQRIALSSVIAAVFLTGMKLIVGILTNSLGILSEAIHSGLDLVAAGITFWAVKVSAKPADRDHLYGHAKFESLSALIETLLLIITAIWIIVEALKRLLLSEGVEVDANIWAFTTVFISVVVDYSRSKALLRVARKYKSQALEADALHFSTDILSSGVVYIGLLLVVASEWTGIGWLMKADAVAALFVAGVVIVVSLNLGKRTLFELLDKAPSGLQKKIIDIISSVEGVAGCERVRVRTVGRISFIDVIVKVDRTMPVSRCHNITAQVENALHKKIPWSDVMVHYEPVRLEGENAVDRIRLIAQEFKEIKGVHNIRLKQTSSSGNRMDVDLHIEVDGDMDLKTAHTISSQLEKKIKDELENTGRVLCHIESITESECSYSEDEKNLESIARQVVDIAASLSVKDCHNIRLVSSGDYYLLELHCRLPADQSVRKGHNRIEKLSSAIREKYPFISEVIIHMEPERDYA